MIFIVPSERRINSLFPKDIPGIEDNDLESLTGADFCISQLPTLPSIDLERHIERGALFVQVKFGGDIFSFDAMNHAVARMNKQKIPTEQCMLLQVGIVDSDTDGYASINGWTSEVRYSAYLAAIAKWGLKGGHFSQITHSSGLSDWIEAQDRARTNAYKEGDRFVYSPPTQLMEEIKRKNDDPLDDFRFLMVRGFCGPVMVENLIDFLQEQRLPVNLFHALCILTDLGPKGKKPFYKVPGWGKKSFWDLRKMLGIPDEFNLGWMLRDEEKGDLVRGANIALDMLAESLREGMKGSDAFNITKRQINEFWIKEI